MTPATRQLTSRVGRTLARELFASRTASTADAQGPALHLRVGQVKIDDPVNVVTFEEELTCRALRGKPSTMKP